MGLEESVESRTYGKECHGDEYAHHAVHHDAAACAPLVLGGEVTLDDGLVGGIGNQVVGHATEDNHPECGAAIIQTPVKQAELAVRHADVEETVHATVCIQHQVADGKNSTAH